MPDWTLVLLPAAADSSPVVIDWSGPAPPDRLRRPADESVVWRRRLLVPGEMAVYTLEPAPGGDPELAAAVEAERHRPGLERERWSARLPGGGS